jgi:hypothetical protein
VLKRFIAAVVAFTLAFAPVARAAVAIDAFSAGAVNGGWRSGVLGRAADLDGFGSPTNDPPVTVNQGFGFITIGASATALVVGVMMASQAHGANNPGTVTVTLNPSGSNQAMTQLGAVVDNGSSQGSPTYLFGLVNPASGLGNIQINWTNHTNIQEFYVYAMSFTGTATSSVSAAFYGFNTAHDSGSATLFNGVTTSQAVSSGDMAFSLHINPFVGFNNPATNATGTEMDDDQAVTNNSYGQYFTGTGSSILAEADNHGAGGTNDFWCAAVVAIGTKPAGSNPTAATHDFVGDGNSDIAWRDTSGNTAIWEMNGTAVTNQNSSFVADVSGQWAIVGQRDFNGDGKADLLWRDTSGNVAIWEMNGTSVLNPNTSFVGNVPSPQWSIVGTGDFNADAKGDLLWQDTSGNVAIWEMNGTSVLNQNSSFVAKVPSQWSIKGTGDFNGDGKTDILWQDTSGNVAIWEMNGTAILNQSTSFVGNVLAPWSIKGTGDFNGDGKADILWGDLSGNVAIWEMNGTTVLNQSTSFVSNVPGPWSIQLTGDYNGDGKADILWQDTSGNLAIWEMNGTTILNLANSYVANVPGPWSVQNLNAE